MPVTNEKSLLDRTYRVLSVEPTPAPEGTQGDSWYRYVIAYGQARIEGRFAGTARDAKTHAETFAEGLNTRSQNKGASAYAPRQKRRVVPATDAAAT